MKGFAEFVVFIFFVVADFAYRHAESLFFTSGFISISIGCAILDTSIGFIVPGTIICGLIIWRRLMVWRMTGKGAAHD